MNNNETAKKLIDDNLYMTISVSSKQGDPWIANLFYAVDSEYNFYWYSSADSLHSRLIQENPIIAISIFNSMAIGDDVDAVYVKAKVFEISQKIELIKALGVYGKKMLRTGFVSRGAQFKKFVQRYEDFQNKSKLRFYKAMPIKIWKLAPPKIFNEKFIDSRIEVTLKNNLV